ncbi:MAG: T9SS type A sorting domain-containing protein [Crocinitomicaceae bacterium]|nr:T9SS type A sorting domain-containing protein [Crocinitomicaceae bacterium]
MNAQIISYFSWDTDPVTQADIGPNGTLPAGSQAYSSPAGFNGTNGINPLEPDPDPSKGVDLTLNASPLFDVDGIDIQIAFRREEGTGNFVTRGTDFNMGMNSGNFFVTFSLDDGAGGSIEVHSGDIYTIPLDGVYRLFRFYYLPDLGIAEASVDGAPVWTYNGTIGQVMYWSAPNIVIGAFMDANGADVAVFDELIIAEVQASPLPVRWLDYSCEKKPDGIHLNWSTAIEINNSHFIVERAIENNTEVFEQLNTTPIIGAGFSTLIKEYSFSDLNPNGGWNYYRIKQIDFDGQHEYTSTIGCLWEEEKEFITLYPNPAKEYVYIKSNVNSTLSLIDANGKEVERFKPIDSVNQTKLDLTNYPSGVYFLKSENTSSKFIKR